MRMHVHWCPSHAMTPRTLYTRPSSLKLETYVTRTSGAANVGAGGSRSPRESTSANVSTITGVWARANRRRGVIGIEYVSMFAAPGSKVTVVEKQHTMLDFCDPEIVEALQFHLRDLAVTFRFGEEVTAVDVGFAGTVTTLASGKQIPAQAVMYSAGGKDKPISSTWPTPGSKPTPAGGSSSMRR